MSDENESEDLSDEAFNDLIDKLFEQTTPKDPRKAWFLTEGDKELLRKMKITPE